jgi:hypothetical protein
LYPPPPSPTLLVLEFCSSLPLLSTYLCRSATATGCFWTAVLLPVSWDGWRSALQQ